MQGRGVIWKIGLAGLGWIGAGALATAEAGAGHPPLWSLFSLNPIVSQTSCGEKILPLNIYENISLYSLIMGFVLVFAAIFLEQKKVKMALWVVAVTPFMIWGYVNFLVDYDSLRRTIFLYNLQAEGTLANIAEAQERYQSEQGNFIKDLKVLESHLAGAHGMDECVRIVELNVSFEHWSAVAQHRSSPDTVLWDSTSGSSLKKG